MRITAIVIVIILVLAGVVIANSAFIVDKREQSLILQFGEPVEAYNAADTDEPGLYFKLPFIQRVVSLEKRILEFDADPQEVLTAEQEPLSVDAFLRYRIADPLLYFQRVGNETVARGRLSSLLQSSLRNVLAGVETAAIISGERRSLMNEVRDVVQDSATNIGIEIVDVRIRRADLPERISQSVFQRMRAEREQEANRIRAEGEQAAREIRADADREAAVIVAKAREESEITRGEGDAERNSIFAASYSKDPEFFAFYRSLRAYENAMRDDQTTLVLSPDSEFFRYFQDMNGDLPPREPTRQ